MKSIAVHSSLSTGLDAAFGHIRSVQIEDAPVGQGGFGIAFRSSSINGSPSQPQIVKILMDNGQGVARQGLNTIQELQRRVQIRDTELRARGKSLLSEFPALQGIPQFSFEGHLDGREVIGYAANDLTHLGMEDFSRVLDDDAQVRQFQAMPLSAKMRLAAQLVDAFQFLSSQILFIHADIKADALFLDRKKLRCAIIDFDSGALARDPGDKPTTFGTKQDWLAPEITQQLDQPGNSARIVKVDLLSDIWSVNIAIHYLLFGFHPLFFLTEVSQRSIDAYFKAFQWPDVNSNFAYFRKEYAAHYNRYAAYLKANLPQEVLQRLAFTINRGYLDPTARTTYGQWKTVLNVLNRPAIKRFGADRSFVTDARPVRLRWEVSGARQLYLDGVGDVTGRTGIDVQVRRNSVFTLVLIADNGATIRKHLKIEVSKDSPRIEHFSVSSQYVREGSEVEFTWRVLGAHELEIFPKAGAIPPEGRVKVRMGRECTFVLTATSYFGVRATKTLTVAVAKTTVLGHGISPTVLNAHKATRLGTNTPLIRNAGGGGHHD